MINTETMYLTPYWKNHNCILSNLILETRMWSVYHIALSYCVCCIHRKKEHDTNPTLPTPILDIIVLLQGYRSNG